MLPMTRLLNEVMDSNWDNTMWTPMVSERMPRTNIYEGEKDYRIEMDLPGIRHEDLDISLESDVLTVKAERNYEAPEGYKAHRCEVTSKVGFRRSFTLGTAVNAEKISAEFKDGVLHIVVPKSERSLPKRIEVK